jgi:hypothetical protein
MRSLALGLFIASGLGLALQSDAASAGGVGVHASTSWKPVHGKMLGPVHRHGHVDAHRAKQHFDFAHQHRRFDDARMRDAFWPFGFGVEAADLPAVGVSGPASLVRVEQPSCRLQHQDQVVVSESGGEAKIGVTRCVVPLRELIASRQSRLRTLESDADEVGSIGQGDSAQASQCGIETLVVPSEDGGQRTVTIRRC